MAPLYSHIIQSGENCFENVIFLNRRAFLARSVCLPHKTHLRSPSLFLIGPPVNPSEEQSSLTDCIKKGLSGSFCFLESEWAWSHTAPSLVAIWQLERCPSRADANPQL